MERLRFRRRLLCSREPFNPPSEGLEPANKTGQRGFSLSLPDCFFVVSEDRRRKKIDNNV